MKTLKVLAGIIFISGLILPGVVQSQGTGTQLTYTRSFPLAGVAERFTPFNTADVSIYFQTNNALDILAHLEYSQLNQVNTEDLYYDDISMNLLVWGASVDWVYPLTESKLKPYVGGGVGLYRWDFERDEYSIPDTTVAADTAVFKTIKPLERGEAAWGLNAIGGIEYKIAGGLAIDVNVRYKIVLASLWPTLRLHLESVDGLQFVNVNAGIRYYW